MARSFNSLSDKEKLIIAREIIHHRDAIRILNKGLDSKDKIREVDSLILKRLGDSKFHNPPMRDIDGNFISEAYYFITGKPYSEVLNDETIYNIKREDVNQRKNVILDGLKTSFDSVQSEYDKKLKARDDARVNLANAEKDASSAKAKFRRHKAWGILATISAIGLVLGTIASLGAIASFMLVATLPTIAGCVAMGAIGYFFVKPITYDKMRKAYDEKKKALDGSSKECAGKVKQSEAAVQTASRAYIAESEKYNKEKNKYTLEKNGILNSYPQDDLFERDYQSKVNLIVEKRDAYVAQVNEELKGDTNKDERESRVKKITEYAEYLELDLAKHMRLNKDSYDVGDWFDKKDADPDSIPKKNITEGSILARADRVMSNFAKESSTSSWVGDASRDVTVKKREILDEEHAM